jgi:hypothetical protein
MAMEAMEAQERLERWRLLLGGHEADGLGVTLTGRALAMDRAMAALGSATSASISPARSCA